MPAVSLMDKPSVPEVKELSIFTVEDPLSVIAPVSPDASTVAPMVMAPELVKEKAPPSVSIVCVFEKVVPSEEIKLPPLVET